MAGVTDRLELAMRVARLYYLEHLGMEEIAVDLHTSRSTVSRLLRLARDRGLVEIRLHDPELATPNLAAVIGERFGVEAHVTPHTADRLSELQTLEYVGRHAARLLGALVGPDMVLGVAWGTTISTVSRYLTPQPGRNVTVVQLNGAGNSLSTGIEYASEVLRRFANAFGGRVEHFPVPTFYDCAATRTSLWRERSIRRLLELQRGCDIVVYGIGALGGRVPSQVYSGGYLDPADLQLLTEDGVVGDIATVFVREDGSYADIALNARSSGPDLRQLARVGERVCVVAGQHRLPGVRAALAAGLVSHLVIDEQAAAALVLRSR